MSAADSIIGQCPDCCICPPATVEWDSRSASLTKCGHTDPSQPDKVFLVKEYCASGQRAVDTYDPSDCSHSIAYFEDIRCCTLFASGGKYYATQIMTRSYDCSYDYQCGTATGCTGGSRRDFGTSTGSATNTYTKHADCTQTETGLVGSYHVNIGYQIYKMAPGSGYPEECTACGWGLSVTFHQTYTSDGTDCTLTGTRDDVWDPCLGGPPTYVDSHESYGPIPQDCVAFSTNICVPEVPAGCTGTAGPAAADSYSYEDEIIPLGNIYSEEYTTTDLKTNTVAALPAYDDDWNDTAGSFANLSTEELSYSIRESRYRLRFKIPIVGFGTCYKVTWVERFTPEGGGAVTDTARCAIWDGTTPGGYVPATPSTYPVLPSASPFYFELPVPSSDGTTTVENVVAECLHCTACP